MDAAQRLSPAMLRAQEDLARRRQAAGAGTHPSDESAGGPDWFALAAGARRELAVADPPAANSPDTVRVAPALAACCLDKEQRANGGALDGPYRLYKILQALDANGRGWLSATFVASQLSGKGSPFYIYGRRQLKNMLRRGEGLFWRRVKSGDGCRVRLVARAKVAAALSCGRLGGREVSLPLSLLLGSGRGRQAQVNAALYATFHAGRRRPDGSAAPISRRTLRSASGCSAYRQRSYEKRMEIRVGRNLRILGAFSDYRLQRARIELGLPAFRLLDAQGVIGRRGRSYVAARLPNSYHAPHRFQVIASQRQKTLNRTLAGLRPMGSGGSGNGRFQRLFHDDAVKATRALEKREAVAFWRQASGANSAVWFALESEIRRPEPSVHPDAC